MTNRRTNRGTAKREKHFAAEKRKRAAVSKKIIKAKEGHDQWTSIDVRRAGKQRDADQ